MTKGHSFRIDRLGEATVVSPIELSTRQGDLVANYVEDDQRILSDIETQSGQNSIQLTDDDLLECAGPRKYIYFNPSDTHAGIVTCGGLCPGLNGVIRAIVMCLWYRYGVRYISGIQYGYCGLIEQFHLPPLELSPATVEDIHQKGGTFLGSSRGHGDKVGDIVDTIERLGLQILFTIGGDGTQRGALNISQEIHKRGLKIAVIGVPKTIDNDLSYIQRSFGFETAVSLAVQAVCGAHVEAHDAVNGIGIVKVMGRQSGFIAAQTALANNDVNYVLIPEVPFDLEGKKGLLTHLENRLLNRRHAVILVAEGAGQDLLEAQDATDASGNIRLGDIGLFLKDRIAAYFKQRRIEVNIKYIDPSYIIRSAPANANDSVYGTRLGTHAVHAAMAGRTEMLVSLWHDCFVHIPMRMAISKRNCVDPEGSLWRDVLEATGQPVLMKN